jgi:hypothetical protein
VPERRRRHQPQGAGAAGTAAIAGAAPPPGSPSGTIQINHSIVDEKDLIYAADRGTGGLYILRYTGKPPLD